MKKRLIFYLHVFRRFEKWETETLPHHVKGLSNYAVQNKFCEEEDSPNQERKYLLSKQKRRKKKANVSKSSKIANNKTNKGHTTLDGPKINLENENGGNDLTLLYRKNTEKDSPRTLPLPGPFKAEKGEYVRIYGGKEFIRVYKGLMRAYGIHFNSYDIAFNIFQKYEGHRSYDSIETDEKTLINNCSTSTALSHKENNCIGRSFYDYVEYLSQLLHGKYAVITDSVPHFGEAFRASP